MNSPMKNARRARICASVFSLAFPKGGEGRGEEARCSVSPVIFMMALGRAILVKNLASASVCFVKIRAIRVAVVFLQFRNPKSALRNWR
jgi:hypothetical protein